MAITWAWINKLKLRHKLALLYTLTFIAILGISFWSIYLFSERYREEEFYKRLSDRTITTFKISVQVDQIDNNMLRLFDENTINSFNDEKILIFDSTGKVIYSNKDIADISYAESALAKLKGDENVFERSDDKYELLGLQFNDRGHTYYGINRAYDRYGRSKMHFLAILLICTFVIVTVLIILLSFYLSALVTKPISRLTGEIDKISPDDLSRRVRSDFSNDEIGYLADNFNKLLDKVEHAFKFQYHYIHHLSHELKTPLAVMMANAERSLAEDDAERLNSSMHFQKNSIMELSNIINAMLDISKTENKLTTIHAEVIRIDEILFECMDDISVLHTGLQFDFKINSHVDEANLTVMGNSRMIKMAVMNMIRNAVNFSVSQKPVIEIIASGKEVQVNISNDGPVIDEEDQSKLFRHLFRGKNSTAVKGFGLGLVLAHRIVTLHKGTLEYAVHDGLNCFILRLPTVI